MANYDFHGWATKANLKCSDGRTIMKDAFKNNDGQTVPLVWNHQHDDPCNVLGHALLENRDEGVYAYCSFNNTEAGQLGKELVQHGDITHLSIYANRLQQQGGNVLHGEIREVSLVHAGANPGATITSVIAHSDTGEPITSEDECIIHTGLEFKLGDEEEEKEELSHADEEEKEEKTDKKEEETKKTESQEDDKETIQDIIDTMNEKQYKVMCALIGQIATEGDEGDEDEEDIEHSEGGNETMKKNVFDNTNEVVQEGVLSHSDQEEIIALAKQSGVGSLKHAMEIYAEENSLQHGFENYAPLFPEYELTKKGAPDLLERDQSWISYVMSKIHKAPYSRIRTRQADARIAELRAKGYQNKGDQKTITGKIKLLSRTTDPQTIYIKDDMHRDDIIDITDFDVVGYQWNIMRHVMEEELALAALIGDGREEGDPDKIHETHIRPIWTDDDLYTIHADVDIAAAKKELQGTGTGTYFGDNYVYAEAIITAALYAREQYKGSGNLDFFCTPHLLNVMLLARDRDGRRMYNSKSDLSAALNVNNIYTIEQFEGKTRTVAEKTKKLLGLFVNLADYQFGSTRGGEITKFEDFDMDFNKYKYMLETRLSGALTKVYSAIALEEPVNAGNSGAAG